MTTEICSVQASVKKANIRANHVSKGKKYHRKLRNVIQQEGIFLLDLVRLNHPDYVFAQKTILVI